MVSEGGICQEEGRRGFKSAHLREAHRRKEWDEADWMEVKAEIDVIKKIMAIKE